MKGLNSGQMISIMQVDYPTLPSDHSTKVQLGLAMKDLGYEHTTHGNVPYYKAVPLRSA